MEDPLKQIPNVQQKPIDPVERSIAKPNAFAKPGNLGKIGAPTNQAKSTRIRPLNWKRGRGRPRIHPKDKRNVTFF